MVLVYGYHAGTVYGAARRQSATGQKATECPIGLQEDTGRVRAIAVLGPDKGEDYRINGDAVFAPGVADAVV